MMIKLKYLITLYIYSSVATILLFFVVMKFEQQDKTIQAQEQLNQNLELKIKNLEEAQIQAFHDAHPDNVSNEEVAFRIRNGYINSNSSPTTEGGWILRDITDEGVDMKAIVRASFRTQKCKTF